MTDDSLTPPPLERLLTALLELPPLLPLHGLASPHEAGDGAAQLVLEVLDTALHTPPAQPQRMAAVRYFCKHARHRLGLASWRDLQGLLEQYPQSDEGDAEVARLLWGVEAQEHVRALRLLVWFMAAYDVTELAQWHAWMGTTGFEEALRESLDTLGAVAVVLLWQAKSGRTDHAWVLRFARRALGHSVSEGPAMLAFRDAAEAMGVPQRVLARQVAHWERAAMGVDDAPGLRVLWWQCVAEALQVHVAQETSTAAISDEWRIDLSPTSALRYGEAGVVLEPQARELQANTLWSQHCDCANGAGRKAWGCGWRFRARGGCRQCTKRPLPSGLRRQGTGHRSCDMPVQMAVTKPHGWRHGTGMKRCGNQ
jgi:hypothetical protein